MAKEKPLTEFGEEQFVRRQGTVQSDMGTDRLKHGFTLNDIAECGMAGARQYCFIQLGLGSEA